MSSCRIKTVEPQLQAFLGRWYQMYGSISSTLLTFGNSGPQDALVSADYTLAEDGSTINVLNQGLRKDGVVTKIWGTARATEVPGQKKLRFSKFIRGDEEVKPPDFEGDYWIYELGPIVDGKYAYAIVGGPALPSWGLDRTQLFVLARDPASYKEKHDEGVLRWLSENGFTAWWNKPRKTGSVGEFRLLPFPKFEDSEGKFGEFGQTLSKEIPELSPPCDGSKDPRIMGA
eukprot:TRINITY_DN64191_c0_g1_i1.p2 TRINITY_DN64191_c0_g1~~TRINITY_DN64191_c0_g1_i1.p2  ORF type:complete len:230 (+),score=54.45 TRINITY_DN64191_c0_g1_i1:78-767(+)